MSLYLVDTGPAAATLSNGHPKFLDTVKITFLRSLVCSWHYGSFSAESQYILIEEVGQNNEKRSHNNDFISQSSDLLSQNNDLFFF